MRIVVRSKEKADAFLASRREHSGKLDAVFIKDLTDPGAFDSAVQDVTGVIHLASVCSNRRALPRRKVLIRRRHSL